MFNHRTWASAFLALGLCNVCIGLAVLLSREHIWIPFARWLGSVPDERLSLLLGLLARGQIILGLALLVAGIAVVRRAVSRISEPLLRPD